jgi:hypothetical protein
VFDLLVLPFESHRTLALVALSVVSGAAFAFLFRATSKPERIKRARNRFQARVLEMRLYPDDVVLLTRALFGALATQLDYFRAAGKPILILAVVATPVFFQIESRFAARPMQSGERAMVTATLKPGLDARAVPMTLAGSEGLEVDPRSVRVRASREVVWGIETQSTGTHELVARVYDQDYRFAVSAEANGRALGRERVARGWDSFLRAGLPPLPENSALQSIRVTYPEARYRVLGWRLGWLSTFLLGSFVGALVPAWLLRIQM